RMYSFIAGPPRPNLLHPYGRRRGNMSQEPVGKGFQTLRRRCRRGSARGTDGSATPSGERFTGLTPSAGAAAPAPSPKPTRAIVYREEQLSPNLQRQERRRVDAYAVFPDGKPQAGFAPRRRPRDTEGRSG